MILNLINLIYKIKTTGNLQGSYKEHFTQRLVLGSEMTVVNIDCMLCVDFSSTLLAFCAIENMFFLNSDFYGSSSFNVSLTR